jgi:predicted Rossmann fold flavoprotein
MNSRKKLIVIGGGAAGFFCAVNAARMYTDLDVCILEKTGKLLSKVKISGGGRCNVTHDDPDPIHMSTAYPRGKNLLKKTLYQFSPIETTRWFKQRGVDLKTESDGRMFPVTNQSQSIIDCLMKEAVAYGVEIRLHHEVVLVNFEEQGFTLKLKSDVGGTFEMKCDYLCVASGGYPKASSFDWLRNSGHTVVEPVPSLFTFNIPDKRLHELMGVSCEQACVRIPELKLEEQGPVLITHWGLSGPAVLKLSSRAARDLHALQYEFDLKVNWVPTYNEGSVLEKLKFIKFTQRSSVGAKNPFSLSTRLWEFLLEKAEIDLGLLWTDIPQSRINKLSKVLCSDSFRVSGKTTFKEEFVTSGGIDLREIDAQTMESKRVHNLYFAGEVLDVDGITGGYNFQHAWSSGWIAANDIASKSKS